MRFSVASVVVAAFAAVQGPSLVRAARPAALRSPPPSSSEQWLRSKFPRPDLTVVLSDTKFLEFTLNSHASFQANAPEAQYLVVGMDRETVEECTRRGIDSVLYADLMEGYEEEEEKKKEGMSDLVKLRCSRLSVVSALLSHSYNVLLLDSDISVSPHFSLSYFPSLEADFVSGHGTFPLDTYEANGFALQSGMYYVRNTEGGKDLIQDAAIRCEKLSDGQVALNQALMEGYLVHAQGVGDSPHTRDVGSDKGDKLGTFLVDASSKTSAEADLEDAQVQQDQAQPQDLRIAILGKSYFPSGCRFISLSSPEAWIRHPGCVSRKAVNDVGRAHIKKKSLQSMGGWYLGVRNATTNNATEGKAKNGHKAALWSFPGSGNTMLRYTFESITNQPGSTDSVYFDPRLSPILPGEGAAVHPQLGQGKGVLIKVHPAQGNDEALANAEKRIVLMRNPYDAIWSWYQLTQTGSHTGRIQSRDFNPEHFAERAREWAEVYRKAVEEEFIPYLEQEEKEGSKNGMLIKFEDLVENQDTTLRRVLNFLNEEATAESELKIMDHDVIKRDPSVVGTVSKPDAYGSNRELVEEMWSVFGDSAERFGYSMPVASGAASLKKKIETPNHKKLTSNDKEGKKTTYLTYAPSGGLTNQLIELEMAVRFAIKSGRTLILPPVLSTPVKVFPELWKDDSEMRRCGAETIGAESVCDAKDYAGVDTYEWEKLVDLKSLSERVPVVTSLPPDEAEGMSWQSLCGYHKCNTRWTDAPLMEGEGCLPGYVPEFFPQPEGVGSDGAEVQVRSLDCLFRFTRDVDVLRFGAVLGTYAERGADWNMAGVVFPQLNFAPKIREAAEDSFVAIAGREEGYKNREGRNEAHEKGGGYLCAHLRLAGSDWETESPFTRNRDGAFARAREFLSEADPEGKLPLYVATDNRDLVLEKGGICEDRTCLFSSDFAEITTSKGLGHIQELIPVEYLTCANADRMIATDSGSSFGWYIYELHSMVQRSREHHEAKLSQEALPAVSNAQGGIERVYLDPKKEPASRSLQTGVAVFSENSDRVMVSRFLGYFVETNYASYYMSPNTTMAPPSVVPKSQTGMTTPYMYTTEVPWYSTPTYTNQGYTPSMEDHNRFVDMWDAAGIDNYDMVAEQSCPSCGSLGPFYGEIRDGYLTTYRYVDPALTDEVPQTTLTIKELLDFIAYTIDDGGFDSMDVYYNTEYGYTETVYIDYDASSFGDETSYVVHKFQSREMGVPDPPVEVCGGGEYENECEWTQFCCNPSCGICSHIGGFCIELFCGTFGPPGGGIDAEEEMAILNLYKSKWESAALTNYDFTFQRSCFCLDDYVAPYDVEVRNGVVSSVSPNPPEFYTVPTIQDLIDEIEDAINANAASLTHSYDSTYGYPTNYFADMDFRIADEESGFSVTNFVVV